MLVLGTTPTSMVEGLLAQMTLAEKIGQMTQVEKDSISPAEVRDYAIGSILSGGGGNPTPNTPANWAAMTREFLAAALETRLGIPLIYGVDAVHGHNNVHSATIFPHNIGLGAAGNAELVADIARITTRELRATNVNWDFAPCVAVPQDIRWGRTYEGFSNRPALASELGASWVRGMQESGHVAACAKHFVADGATVWGTRQYYKWIHWNNWDQLAGSVQIDQGDALIDEETLRAVHLPPYIAAIEANVGTIMASYSSWNGAKLHGHRYLLTDVLKEELGFQGFVVSDWMAIDQLDEDYDTAVVQSINAGVDMIMVPFDFKRFIDTLNRMVEQGAISMARIDDAVRRILRVKAQFGLFEQPFGDESLLSEVGSEAHRAVARQAVRESLVLLKNEGAVLPIAKDVTEIVVAGAAADDVGLQCGGWTIEWLGRPGAITPGTTLLEGLQQTVAPDTRIVYSKTAEFAAGTHAPVGLVVISEQPYAEGEGDTDDLTLRAEQRALIASVRAHCDQLVLVVISGRPLIITDVVADCDAIVAAWLPGTEGHGMSDVLLGDEPFTGRLPFDWPTAMQDVPKNKQAPLWPYGYGLL